MLTWSLLSKALLSMDVTKKNKIIAEKACFKFIFNLNYRHGNKNTPQLPRKSPSSPQINVDERE